MRKRRSTFSLTKIAAVILPLAFLLGFTACTSIDNDVDETKPSKPVITPGPNVWDPYGNPKESKGTTETSETPAVTETSETAAGPSETTVPDIDYIRDIWIYSVWYDAVIDNPADYESIDSEDAFALKGVFYFNTPLTAVFEARLYKDNSVILKRNSKLKDNVTAEADFSAGLEGLGTFESGDYYIELFYNGESVAATTKMRVK